MTRRITAPTATPPFSYELMLGQPANLLFAGSMLFSHGFVLPVLRVHRPDEVTTIVAAEIPGFADAVGMWFPTFLALPFKFDPVLLSERIANAARDRIDAIRARIPDATRIDLDLHGGFETRLDQGRQLAGLVAAELPEPDALTMDDIAIGNARFREALAFTDTTERVERFLHFLLSVLHHVLAHEIPHLVVADEDPCETTTIWQQQGELQPVVRAWRGSSLYRSIADQEDKTTIWSPPFDDPSETIERATLLAGFLPWSSARHFHLARVLARECSHTSAIIHATEALFLAEREDVPANVLGELHALRGLAWDSVCDHYPRAQSLAAHDLKRAFELGVRLDREVMLRLIDRFS